MLERCYQVYELAEGATAEIWHKTRKGTYTCRLSFDGDATLERGGFATMDAALEWARSKAEAHGIAT